MKRYVRCSSTPKYSIEDFATIAKVADHTVCDSEATEAILYADKTGLLQTFAQSIYVARGKLELNGDVISIYPGEGYSKANIIVKFDMLPLRTGQETDKYVYEWFTPDTKLSSMASRLASGMRKVLNRYYKSYQEYFKKNSLRSQFNTETTELISAFAVACRYVRKYAGLTPTFRYSDSGKAEYMLWDLPDVEVSDPPHLPKLNMDALLSHEKAFKDALSRFENDTQVTVSEVYCPHGGNYVRSAFLFRVNPKIQLVHDKISDTYQLI